MGEQVVVRNDYLPERKALTGIGPVTVKVPKVHDCSGNGVKFNTSLVPSYVRESPRVSEALPWLYRKGTSTDDGEALPVLLGEEWPQWERRDLSAARYVYW